MKLLLRALFHSSLQVIKAALAQVKAVADGGVTAADLTRAKWVRQTETGWERPDRMYLWQKMYIFCYLAIETLGEGGGRGVYLAFIWKIFKFSGLG